MSRCTHGVSPTNSSRNSPAMMAPPDRFPTFRRSAICDSIIAPVLASRAAAASSARRPRSPAARTSATSAVVVADTPPRSGAERDHARAGERRGVDDVALARAREVRERVGQDHPALRVGVLHLERLAAAGRITSPGFGAEPTACSQRAGPRRAPRAPSWAGRAPCIGRARPPRPPCRPSSSSCPRVLDRDPPRVERDPLADDRHRRAVAAAGRTRAP